MLNKEEDRQIAFWINAGITLPSSLDVETIAREMAREQQDILDIIDEEDLLEKL